MTTSQYDYIVVGGGVCGLQLGALLSRDGHRVLLLEKQKKLGGRAAVIERDGFTVDMGIHLVRFGPKSAISETCRRLGHEVAYAPLGTSRVVDHDGITRRFPTSPGGILRTKLFRFREKLKALGVLLRVKRKGAAKLPADLEAPSVLHWMDRRKIRGGLRRYFTLVASSMLVCPFVEKAAVTELLTNMQKVLKVGISVQYPKGGWLPLFELFRGEIEKRGEVRTGCPVESVLVKEGRACGVAAGGERVEAGAVILNLPCQQIFSVLDENRVDPAYRDMCRNQRPTAGVVVDFGLKKRVSDTSGLWYFWDPPSFGMFTSNLEPALAPEGKQLFTFFYPTALEDMEDVEVARKREEELLTRIFATFPDMEGQIEWKRILHMPMVDGTEINIHQTRDRRPGYRVPGTENLYLVGDSLGAPGAGGDVGHESVHECYEAIRRASAR
jgi:phytoene dehydrogenase-like protein